MSVDDIVDINLIKQELELRKKLFDYQQRARDIQNRAAREHDDQLKRMRRTQMVMTRASGGGGMFGNVMNLIQGLSSIKQENLHTLKQLKSAEKERILNPQEARQRNLIANNKTSNNVLQRLEDIFENSFGGDSKWNKMFGGQGKVAAAGIGGAAFAVGLALSAKIIDSSPLMQQMLKLLDFGIMLVLRPIGDFFAMLFRPILIFLLRKFIIPFYQTVYPWFMKNANMINDTVSAITQSGEGVVKGIEESAKVAAATTGKGLTAISDILKPPTTSASSHTPLSLKALPENPRNLPVVAGKVPPANIELKKVQSLTTKSDKVVSAAMKATKTINALSMAPFKLAEKAITKVTIPVAKAGIEATKAVTNVATGGLSNKALSAAGSATSKAISPVKSALSPLLTKVMEKGSKIAATTAIKTASRAIPVVGQALMAVDVAGSAMKQFSPETYQGIREGALGIGSFLGDTEGTYTEHALDFLGFGKKSTAEQVTGLAGGVMDFFTGTKRDQEKEGAFGLGGIFGMANGGIIREPIRGIGRSGQKYMFGERGSEAVIPMRNMGGSSGVTVNVTVNGSIYSDKDMLKFQRTIMKAIETSSTRKSKI